jgi:dUTP pyrophosphatase
MIERGIRIRPARSSVVTDITGAEKITSAKSPAEPAIEITIPIPTPNGSAASRSIGNDRAVAKRIPMDGQRRSEYCTQIDYARGVSVDVLIVAEPEFLPSYANPGDAGADLKSTEDIIIPSRGRALIHTGVKIALPAGYVALVHPRSGLAAKSGITVLNAPGTVDAGYRGEIMVTLFNSSDIDFSVQRGDRIAQLVVQQFETANFVSVRELPESERGARGFGSTGRN